MNNLDNKISVMRNKLLNAFPHSIKQAHLILVALLSRGHVLIEDYEGSDCRKLICLIDDLIDGVDQERRTSINCHSSLEISYVLPIILKSDVVILDYFNRASREFQILIGQLLRDREVLIPDSKTQAMNLFKLPETILIAARINRHEGGLDAIPYEISGNFLFNVTFEPTSDETVETQRELKIMASNTEDPHDSVITSSELANYWHNVSKKLFHEPNWDCRLIKLANSIKRSSDTISRSRPSSNSLREIKKAWHVALHLRGILQVDQLFTIDGAKVIGKTDADSAAFFIASLGHRFPRKLNTIFTGTQIIERTLKQEQKESGISPDHTGRESDDTHRVAALSDAYNVFSTMRQYLESTVFGRNEGDDREPHANPALGTINLILAALFSRGHLLLEDYPGTGKTYMIKMLTNMIEDDIVEAGINIEGYRRIQCVPDLMPGDITGYEALIDGHMIFRKGPIFCYVLLLDEINRTTPKVQSALLEAMAESHITVGDRTYELGELFFVVATQNPYDSVGTFQLPAAQLDRFLFKRRLRPVSDKVVEQIIFSGDPQSAPRVPITRLIAATKAVREINSNNKVMGPYLRQIGEVFNGRISAKVLKEGSKPSPRSLQGLLRALKVIALIRSNGVDLQNLVVRPTLVREIACDYFRHRIFPVNEEINDSDRDDLILKIIDEVDQSIRVACI